MRINAIKGRQGLKTEVQDATYVEAARWGKYRGWRYVLGLVVILFAWLVVGTGASVLVAIAFSG
ncbi:CPBP family intramembrane metalloprotease domain-containing protein, partial [Leptolyngbya sp. ST-U4]